MSIYIGKNLELGVMKMIFSLFLIALALYFIFFSQKIRLEANLQTVLVCASLAGAANGFFGIGGPPMALYFLAVTKEKEEYIGTTQTYFLLTSVYTTIIRIMSGVFDRELLLLALPGIAAILIGEWIGGRIVDKISYDKMTKLIYFFGSVSVDAGVFSGLTDRWRHLYFCISLLHSSCCQRCLCRQSSSSFSS